MPANIASTAPVTKREHRRRSGKTKVPICGALNGLDPQNGAHPRSVVTLIMSQHSNNKMVMMVIIAKTGMYIGSYRASVG